MIMKLVATLVMGILLLPVSAMAEKLVFAVVEWPPVVIAENGQIRGISPDITREVCKRIPGIEPEFELLPLKRALKYLKEGKVCMASLFYKEERSRFLYYSSDYQYKVVNSIVAPKKSRIKVTKLDDLKDKFVGVMDAYHYGSEFDDRGDLKKARARDLSELVRIFEKGRVDVIAVEENGFKFMCRELGFDKNRFESVYTLSEKPFYTVFPKTMGPKGELMADKFGKILRQIREEGVIQQIMDKYR